MKVYISGKIGEDVISDATREKFKAAQEMLQSLGYEVFNPTCKDWEGLLKKDYADEKETYIKYDLGEMPDFYAYALWRDNRVIATKDAIFMLWDWFNSPGAKAELAFAKATKKKILWQDKMDAIKYLRDKWWDEECDRFLDDETAEGTCEDEIDKYLVLNLDETWLPSFPKHLLNEFKKSLISK